CSRCSSLLQALPSLPAAGPSFLAAASPSPGCLCTPREQQRLSSLGSSTGEGKEVRCLVSTLGGLASRRSSQDAGAAPLTAGGRSFGALASSPFRNSIRILPGRGPQCASAAARCRRLGNQSPPGHQPIRSLVGIFLLCIMV
ncbi:unnamed protein product, partial [Urochloa humidicola]